jgi:hypothetical protein
LTCEIPTRRRSVKSELACVSSPIQFIHHRPRRLSCKSRRHNVRDTTIDQSAAAPLVACCLIVRASNRKAGSCRSDGAGHLLQTLRSAHAAKQGGGGKRQRQSNTTARLLHYRRHHDFLIPAYRRRTHCILQRKNRLHRRRRCIIGTTPANTASVPGMHHCMCAVRVMRWPAFMRGHAKRTRVVRV